MKTLQQKTRMLLLNVIVTLSFFCVFETAHAQNPTHIQSLCQSLLIGAEMPESKLATKDALFRLLSVDYPILFTPRMNQIILGHLVFDFGRPSEQLNLGGLELKFFKSWSDVLHTYGKDDEIPQVVTALKEDLLSGEPQLSDKLHKTVEEAWASVVLDFTRVEQSLPVYWSRGRYYDSIANQSEEIAALLQSIDTSPRLKNIMLDMIKELMMTADQWALPLRNGFNSRYVNASVEVNEIVKVRLKVLKRYPRYQRQLFIPVKEVPLSLSAELATMAKPLPSMQELKQKFASEVPVLTPNDSNALLHFDAEIRQATHDLHLYAMTELVGFREARLWDNFYQLSGDLLKSSESGRADLSQYKVSFLHASSLMHYQMNQYRLGIEDIHITILEAKRAVGLHRQRLSELQLAGSPTEHTMTILRDRSLGELNTLMDELQALDLQLDGDQERLVLAKKAFESMVTEVSQSSGSIKNTKRFKADAGSVVAVLKLNGALLKHLKTSLFSW